MDGITEDTRQLARHLVKTFGGSETFTRHHDEDKTSHIDLLVCADAPEEHITCYATLGLSKTQVSDPDGETWPFGVEIVGACESEARNFGRVLAFTGQLIQKGAVPVYPGIAIEDGFNHPVPISKTLSHAFLIEPFLWEEGMDEMKIGDREIVFLQMHGISDAELEYLQSNGPDELIDQFVEQDIDIFDVDRPCIFAG